MPKCSINCPKVRRQLRAAIEETPSVLHGTAFSREKIDIDSRPQRDFVIKDIRDEPKRAIVPVDISKEPIIEEPTQEQRIVQEITITHEPTIIPIEETIVHDGEKIDLVEDKELVIEKIEVETAKEVPDEPVIIEDKIDRTIAPIKVEVEPPRKPDKDLKPEIRVDHVDEEEGITDYDKFIDEELQNSLPAVIAKEIPQEPEVARREISKDMATVYEEIDREEPVRPPKEREPMIPEAEIAEAETREAPSPEPIPAAVEDVCDETCFLLDEQKERIIRQLTERRQRIIDHYYLTRGFNYFKDVCTCSLACVLYTLNRDQFVRSIFASLALFAVGLKLCSELDAWEMPSRIM